MSPRARAALTPARAATAPGQPADRPERQSGGFLYRTHPAPGRAGPGYPNISSPIQDSSHIRTFHCGSNNTPRDAAQTPITKNENAEHLLLPGESEGMQATRTNKVHSRHSRPRFTAYTPIRSHRSRRGLGLTVRGRLTAAITQRRRRRGRHTARARSTGSRHSRGELGLTARIRRSRLRLRGFHRHGRRVLPQMPVLIIVDGGGDSAPEQLGEDVVLCVRRHSLREQVLIDAAVGRKPLASSPCSGPVRRGRTLVLPEGPARLRVHQT